MSTPQRPGLAAVMARIPAEAREAAARLGPLAPEPGETAEQAAERRAAQAANRAARWMRRLPVMYAQATLDDLGPDQHPETVAAWLATPSATLVLAGSVGTGKTHAAYAVGHQAVSQGLWVEAWTLADLLEALRPNGDADALDAVRSCDLLVLDDLGATKVSEWAVETMVSLLDHRLREQRRQVFTTNDTYETIEAAWGGRFADRLRFRWTVVAMVGESRRKAAW